MVVYRTRQELREHQFSDYQSSDPGTKVESDVTSLDSFTAGNIESSCKIKQPLLNSTGLR